MAGRLLLAVLSVAAALLIRLWVAPALFEHATYMPFFFAIATTAALAGMQLGLVATALSVALSAYFLLPPAGSFWIDSPHDRVQLLLFSMMAGSICYISGSLYNARLRAVAYAADQRRLRDEAEAWHARYETAVKASRNVLYDCDRETEQVVYGGDIEAILGYTAEELNGDIAKWVALIHAEDRAIFLQELDRTRTDRSIYQAEYRMIRKDGGVVWMQDEGHFVLIGKESRPTRIIGFVRDVTEQRRQAADRQQAINTLNSLIDSAPVGICVLDAAMRYTHINSHLAEMNGLPVAAHIGKTVGEVVPTLLPAVEPWFQQVMATGRSLVDHALEGETAKCPGELRQWVESWFPILGTDGRPEAVGIIVREVTEQLRVERTLRATEERFRLAAEAVNGIIYECDLATGHVERQRGLYEVLGYQPSEVPDTAAWWSEQIHPEDLKRVTNLDLQTVHDGPNLFEYRVRHKDGRWLHVEDRSMLLRGEDGRPIRLVGCTVDVTARYQAEAERRRWETFISGVLGSITDAFIVVDKEWRFTFANDEIVRRFGLPRDEVLGVSMWELFPAAVGNEAHAQLHRAMAERVTVEYEAFYEPWQRWFLDKAYPTDDGGLAVYSQDITLRKQAEEQLRFQHDLTKSITDNAATAIFMLDDKSRCTFMNPAAEQMTGFRFEEIKGGVLHDFIHHHRSDGRPYPMPECPIDRALPEGGEVRDHEDVFFRKTGEAFLVKCNARVVYKDGVPAGTVIEVRDITKEKAAAEELRRLMADLSEADRRKDEFLATLAHELRNPLAPIRNGLQIMKLAHGDDDTVEKSRAMLERQVEQMTRMIEDLMDVSRISRGRIVLQKKMLPLADAVCNAVDTSRPLIEERGHELVIDLPPEPIHVDGDITRLSQVFANLLNNAAKYTDQGGRIRLAVERQGSDVLVSVEDNGVGIAANMLPRVFEMFTQIDRSLEKAQGGLGIGLNIVKRLVEMHEGSITAESRGPGLGSTFTVRLPVVSCVAGDTETNGENQGKTAAGRRILVVDDNVDGANSLAMMLKIMGNDTQTAHDGQQAVEVASVFRPEVILMDLGMPKLNGFDACRRIREQPWGKDMILVAQTGWGQDDDKRKSLAAGFNFHIVKPVDPVALEKMLARLLPAMT